MLFASTIFIIKKECPFLYLVLSGTYPPATPTALSPYPCSPFEPSSLGNSTGVPTTAARSSPESCTAALCCDHLHELYRGEPPPNNPFLPVFVNILHPPDNLSKGTGKKLEYAGQLPKFSQSEIAFLSSLITDKNSKELLKRTASQVMSLDVTNHQPTDTTSLRLSLAELIAERSDIAKSAIPVVYSHPQLSQSPGHLSDAEQVKRTCEALLCGPTPTLAQQYFTPEIIRLTPQFTLLRMSLSGLHQ
ncbi:hypothetical protein C7M84_025273 [Penaeus vannamei]|uniref:CCR4-NOT transcription complex subunit 11 n=1 Tax=Penaeus vannamei TaxID=6689 RepID=A0A3R7MH47_PENVA|nr:hypothetical protein C7M84_025273 [Penaeus vannamei]